jgi:hypothetical protein
VLSPAVGFLTLSLSVSAFLGGISAGIGAVGALVGFGHEKLVAIFADPGTSLLGEIHQRHRGKSSEQRSGIPLLLQTTIADESSRTNGAKQTVKPIDGLLGCLLKS